MEVEILGSGGATPTPRPGCDCRVCAEARRHRGPPYTRSGPSVFVHGPDVLFDTPEDARQQLEDAHIDRISACFYSHWHPDHTMGRRIWETRNGDFRSWPPETKRQQTTDIYLPQQVAADARRFLGLRDHLEFMASRGWVRVHELSDGDEVQLDGVAVRPFRLAEDYVYAFELRERDRRVLLALDELKGWTPPPDVRGCDLAVLPMGICEHHPLTGERRIHVDHPLLRYEATFDETLSIVAALGARQVVLSHIEELDGLTIGDLARLEERLDASVRFAFDGFRARI